MLKVAMLQVKAEGVHNGQQRTSVVLCYLEASPGDEREAGAALPSTFCELILYELPMKPGATPPWPLAYQEALVYRINTHLETLRAAEGLGHVVKVKNDTFVNDAGFGSTEAMHVGKYAVDAPEEGKQQEDEPAISGAMQAKSSNFSPLDSTYEVSRKWQQVPMLPLSCSRLSFETKGNELIVRCRYG
jgi:hypothetical protein